ncbi:hypothetical protein [Microbacterium sp.]|uniref:hypothetical protein n=1 Tax=Microbacterium sp. TaxID=51671 RepID=UPI0039E2C4C5
MSRTLNVVRMQLINRQTFIWIPLIILGGAVALSIAVYAILAAAGIDDVVKAGGAASAPLWYFVALGIGALSYTFPFSQAMSVTRREFFLGTMLTAVGASALLAILFILGGLIEQATHGWGLNGYIFYLDWIWVSGPLAAGFTYFSAAMLLFTTGFGFATVYKRFGPLGLTLTFLGLAVLLVAVLWVVAWSAAWVSAIEWILTQGALGLALWGLALTVVIAAASYLTLRRAVP